MSEYEWQVFEHATSKGSRLSARNSEGSIFAQSWGGSFLDRGTGGNVLSMVSSSFRFGFERRGDNELVFVRRAGELARLKDSSLDVEQVFWDACRS
jgi:hypothetical protein